MSARLTTAIRIADAANGVLLKALSIPDAKTCDRDDFGELGHIGVEPMLLALSMELALKAWFVFDFDDPHFLKSHNLTKLFECLKIESQNQLDAEFKISVAPYHPNFVYADYSIRHILHEHQNAFTDWRYFHEAKKSMMFEQSSFEATLEMVLSEFQKRYRVEKATPSREL